MRSRTPPDLAGRCPRCFFRLEHCLCARIPRISTRVRYVVIRHSQEAWRTTNTARLAALALENSELHDYGVKDRPFDPAVLEGPDTWLLFPDDSPRSPPPAPPARLVVVDGSWNQARRMIHSLPALWRLPRLSLPPPPPEARRLRTEPIAQGMATLEAMARAVALLEGEEKGRLLDVLHEEMIARVLLTRGRPGLDPEKAPESP